MARATHRPEVLQRILAGRTGAQPYATLRQRWAFARTVLLPLALLAFAPAAAFACRCPAHRSLSDAYRRAASVITGKVTALQKNADGNGSTATLTVSQSWKAQAPQIISVSTSTTCAFNFVEGEEYLLYLYRTEKGGYYTSKCVGDLPLAKAETALSWLKLHGKASPAQQSESTSPDLPH
jgi:hypothetical protein